MKWVNRSRTSLQGDEKGEGESKNRHPSLFMTWVRVGHFRKNGSYAVKGSVASQNLQFGITRRTNYVVAL